MQATLALPAHHPRSSAGGVAIVPPPDLGNQTGIAQIPGKRSDELGRAGDSDHAFSQTPHILSMLQDKSLGLIEPS